MQSTHSDDSLAETQGPSAAKLSLVLRLVVAQSVVLQNHPAILPAVDVVGPLQIKKLLSYEGGRNSQCGHAITRMRTIVEHNTFFGLCNDTLLAQVGHCSLKRLNETLRLDVNNQIQSHNG